MEFTITVSGARTTALGRARAHYNASNPTLSESEYVQKMVDSLMDNLVASYTVAEMDPVQWQRERFTSEERAAIRLAGKTSGEVADLLALLDHPRARLRLDDPLVIDGLARLVAANLLEPHRPAEILML